MQGPVRRGDADEAVRVAAPCRTRPSEDSSAAPPSDTRGRTYRSLAPRRSARLIVVGSLFGGHQFLGKAAPKITLRCFHQPGHQIFWHSVDRSILIDFGVD